MSIASGGSQGDIDDRHVQQHDPPRRAALRVPLLTGGDSDHHRDRAGADRLSAPGRDIAYQLSPRGRRELTGFGLDSASRSTGTSSPSSALLDRIVAGRHL